MLQHSLFFLVCLFGAMCATVAGFLIFESVFYILHLGRCKGVSHQDDCSILPTAHCSFQSPKGSDLE